MNVSEGGVLKQQQQQHQQQHQQQTRKRDSPLCLLLVDLFRGCVWALLLFFFLAVFCVFCAAVSCQAVNLAALLFLVLYSPFPPLWWIMWRIHESVPCTNASRTLWKKKKKGRKANQTTNAPKSTQPTPFTSSFFIPFIPLFFFFHCDETPGVMVSSVLHVLRGQADPYTVAIAGGFSVFWLSLYSRRPSFLAFSAIGFLPLLLLPDYSVTCQ